MALYQRLNSIFPKGKNLLNLRVAFTHNESASDKIVEKIREKQEEDMPVEMENPFVKEKPKCLLCKYNIEPDFKNVRLLTQFISSYTGRIYGRHITGLCEYKHKKVEIEIRKAQTSGLMGTYAKNPNYLQDPPLYDPNNPLRPHPY